MARSQGDVLLAVDGLPIANDGTVAFRVGEWVGGWMGEGIGGSGARSTARHGAHSHCSLPTDVEVIYNAVSSLLSLFLLSFPILPTHLHTRGMTV